MAYALFYMYEGRRKDIISQHVFYVEQAKKRLLSQFDNISEEAEKYADEWLEEAGQNFDPERHFSDDFEEAAYHESISFYTMLSEMHERTINSVIAGIFHEWEKQLREWIKLEIQRIYHGKNTQNVIHKSTFHKIIDLFEYSGWHIKSKPYFNSLDRCRLVVNAYKHGEGDAMQTLRKCHPNLFKSFNDYFGEPPLEITLDHLEEFSEAITHFWNDLPEYIYDNHDIVIAWLGDAYLKDKKIPIVSNSTGLEKEEP